MLDLLLIASLGFLGSFGHCAGMCGPIAIAFSLSEQKSAPRSHPFWFHLLLNAGRIASYALVGAGVGAIGSVVIAGGQLAGIGSALRQGMAIVLGLLLIWMGLIQIAPKLLPRIPIFHPLVEGKWHNRLSSGMVSLSLQHYWWTPALLGLVWGLIPCGFLYTAQIKAAETASVVQGGLTMLAFGIGTLPMMLLVGVGGAMVSAERRNQLFRLGGWITLLIGVLTLLRSGTMEDYTGYAALVCLLLALVARPLNRLLSFLLPCRRVFGVSGFGLAVAHVAHLITMGWDIQALPFLVPSMQIGTWAGMGALALLVPLTITSFDRMQRWLGDRWRLLHLLSIPAFLLAVLHTILLGSEFLGALEWSWMNWLATGILSAIALLTLLIRYPWFWSLLSLEKYHVAPLKSK
ncbi:MAG: sulfite exporter TauE/SafE family protein [Oscillatoriales cyanobacterium C42_A2020_001]|nr:sulfite exporter TauE/SafE family protein [Leptolyngbyaceae cyanobacterium C42_A2020_001]